MGLRISQWDQAAFTGEMPFDSNLLTLILQQVQFAQQFSLSAASCRSEGPLALFYSRNSASGHDGCQIGPMLFIKDPINNGWRNKEGVLRLPRGTVTFTEQAHLPHKGWHLYVKFLHFTYSFDPDQIKYFQK